MAATGREARGYGLPGANGLKGGPTAEAARAFSDRAARIDRPPAMLSHLQEHCIVSQRREGGKFASPNADPHPEDEAALAERAAEEAEREREAESRGEPNHFQGSGIHTGTTVGNIKDGRGTTINTMPVVLPPEGHKLGQPFQTRAVGEQRYRVVGTLVDTFPAGSVVAYSDLVRERKRRSPGKVQPAVDMARLVDDLKTLVPVGEDAVCEAPPEGGYWSDRRIVPVGR